MCSILVGCAGLPVPESTPEPLWEARRPALEALDQWLISGRVAIWAGEEGWNANLRWYQQMETFRLDLVGPLGQGTVQLSGRPGEVTLRLSQGEVYQARDAERLMSERLGWQVPVTGLRYWIRGLPAPDQAFAKVLDENGRLATLQQAGWHISFRRYTQVEALELPDKLFMEHTRLGIRLVISQWKTALSL